MITLDAYWFSSALGFPLYNYPEGTKQYPCDTVEDFEKIGWEVVKPEYDAFLKKGDKDQRNKAFYMNGRAVIYYIMLFGSENEKLRYNRPDPEDVLIGTPSRYSKKLFMEEFYPTIWRIVFNGQEKYLPQNKEDYMIVDNCLDMGVWLGYNK